VTGKYMTLNITVMNEWGSWQCADHLLWDTRSRTPRENLSAKQVNLECPDGRLMLTYAGIGDINGVEISDWIRETLRGQSRGINATIQALAANSTQDLAPLAYGARLRHLFSIVAHFKMGRRWLVQVRNLTVPAPGLRSVLLRKFEIATKEFNGTGIVTTFGVDKAIVKADWALLNRATRVRPRQPRDFSGLLAAVHERAAASPAGAGYISSRCVTTYMPADPSSVGESFSHGAPRGVPEIVIPQMLFGIDLTPTTRALARHASKMDEARLRGEPPPPLDINKSELESSTQPQNRLRRKP
jgi:hypothetical protein